jgi:hypothetical protein
MINCCILGCAASSHGGWQAPEAHCRLRQEADRLPGQLQEDPVLQVRLQEALPLLAGANVIKLFVVVI